MFSAPVGKSCRAMAKAKSSDIWAEAAVILAALIMGKDATTAVPFEEPSVKTTRPLEIGWETTIFGKIKGCIFKKETKLLDG